MKFSMMKQVWLGITLAIAAPLWSQVETNATETATNPVEDARMQTPPPVRGADYPTTGLSEVRSNYLRGGLTFSTAYSDNVLGSTTGNPISDVSYSIWPSIALDETTPRLHWVFSYAPGFTFYQRTSSRNQADHNLGVDFRYRLSPHVTLDLRDSFHKSSSFFNQPDLVASGAVSGSAQSPVTGIIAPLADQLSNTGDASLSYQFSAYAMVGASGTFNNLRYLNKAEVPGLYDSDVAGGSAFYNHRLSKKHYVGATYQYSRILSYVVGAQSETETHAILAFYTLYVTPTLSLSFSGGPQHYDISQGQLFPHARAWSPAATASLGWQGQHTGFAAGYSRTVTGGGGLSGAFHSNSASASVRHQLTRNWNAGVAVGYSITKTVTPFFFLQSSQDGHSISGSASVQRRLGEHVSVEAGYTRLHQSYSNIAAIATAPDTNRESISISYQFARPLGR